MGCVAGSEDGEHERIWDSGLDGKQGGAERKENKNASELHGLSSRVDTGDIGMGKKGKGKNQGFRAECVSVRCLEFCHTLCKYNLLLLPLEKSLN